MGNFKRGGSFGDKKRGGGFDRRDSGRGRRGDDFGRPTMHKAVCVECGETCEVPFKPTSGKPVYCSNCFKSKDSSGPRQSRDRDFNRSGFGDKKMFNAVCDNCGENCEVPFRPTAGKPVYCSNCFNKEEKSDRVKSSGNGSFNEQFEILNSKIDRILKALESTPSSRPSFRKDVKKSEPKKVFKKPGKKIISSKSKAIKKTKKK